MTEKRERKQDKPGTPAEIREIVIARRLALGLSTEELAERSEVGVSHLKDYVSRRADMVGKRLDRVIKALGLEWPK